MIHRKQSLTQKIKTGSGGFLLEVETTDGSVKLFTELRVLGSNIGNFQEGWIKMERVKNIITDSGVGPYCLWSA